MEFPGAPVQAEAAVRVLPQEPADVQNQVLRHVIQGKGASSTGLNVGRIRGRLCQGLI